MHFHVCLLSNDINFSPSIHLRIQVLFCYAAILVPAAGGDLIVFWFGGDHGREGFDLHIRRRIKCPDDYE
ncbi:hypothetical protein P8452_48185 [Trifolium repens]|nr:hypothetical protein P8452_48185 [Trifolium repens]